MRLSITFLLTLTACGAAVPPPEGATPMVVATVSPITDMVRQVGCGVVEVSGLVPEGVNSHTFEPKPSDAALLAKADMFFANGLNLESPSLELARANVADPGTIVEIGPQVVGEDEWIFDFSFPAGDPNPHIWTDPTLAVEMIEIIRERLVETAPDQVDRIDDNAARLTARVTRLDEAIRTATATIPPDDRKLLTYHDSFPYFARTYGWKVIGAIQPADFSEPTAAEVAALIDQIRSEQVPAIFGSEVFPSPVLKAIAAESGATYVDDLRDDDLPGEPGDPDHTYLGLMVSNLETMVEALGGDATAFRQVDTTSVCP